MDYRALGKAIAIYAVVLPAGSLAVLFGGSYLIDVSFPLLAMGTFILSLGFVALQFGTGSTGPRSAAATATGGIGTVTDPSRYAAPDVPGRMVLLCYFVGLGIGSLVVLGLAR